MVKKKVTKKKSPPQKKSKNKDIEDILIQNSANMQKVMIKLAERFERLSDKIDELLELFEDSAKILVKKEIESGRTENADPEVLEKINKLMDQNKIIAKGLTLMHEHKSSNPPQESFVPKANFTRSPHIEEDNFIPTEIKTPVFKKPISKPPQEKKPVFEIPE